MGPVKHKGVGYVKHHKKEKKKWKEEQLLRKLKHQAAKEVVHQEEHIQNSEVTVKDTVTVATLSIAVPGSILDNAQSPELRTYLAGQIARAACVFRVDEVIVFDDLVSGNVENKDMLEEGSIRHCCVQLARILQYLECPQYLRKYFFPIHKDLQYAGLLNPLDAPHHLRQHDDFPFREGVTTNMPVKAGRGSAVNVGLLKDVIVDKHLAPGLRVTVKIHPPEEGSKKLRGTVVSPSQPQIEIGTYWGYTVRIASSLSAVFSQSPYPDGYDISVGTSDKGQDIDSLSEDDIPQYHHALVVFGGLQGLEAALENDEQLEVDDPSLLFDLYLNTCPTQGSRTIRTEEAILISLAELRTKLLSKNKIKK